MTAAAETSAGARGPVDRAARVRARVRAHRRRFARRIGVRLTDLDAVTNERLTRWAHAMTRLEFDAEVDDPEVYWRAQNATARALGALEERVRELGLDRRERRDDLADYLARTYGKQS